MLKVRLKFIFAIVAVATVCLLGVIAMGKLALVLLLFVWSGSGVVNLVESYDSATVIRVFDNDNDNYSSRIVGDLFVSSYLTGLGATASSEGPPYSYALGFYLKNNVSCYVQILNATIAINNGDAVSFLNEFQDSAVLCSAGSAELKNTHYGSEWLKTKYFILASPSAGDKIAIDILLKVRGSKDGEGTQKKIHFDFVPVTKMVEERYI